jgi:phosphoribosylamine---glycine ligase
MKILVVGSGGREHAILWKLKQSQRVTKLYCAPGNAGIAELAECVPIKAIEIDTLAQWAKEHAIDLTIIGMDDPLMLGIVDKFEAEGLKVFGPRQNAAILEGSKVFSKDLMKKYHIPTAGYASFTDPSEALLYLETCTYPTVLKADGLALGKGVLICENKEQGIAGIQDIMIDKKFGDAGHTLVIEEFMTGPEVSVLSFCDGETVLPMVSAQDHKRALDNDGGLNTGGMGTFSPSKYYTEAIHQEAIELIYKPTLAALKAEGRPFTGINLFWTYVNTTRDKGT